MAKANIDIQVGNVVEGSHYELIVGGKPQVYNWGEGPWFQGGFHPYQDSKGVDNYGMYAGELAENLNPPPGGFGSAPPVSMGGSKAFMPKILMHNILTEMLKKMIQGGETAYDNTPLSSAGEMLGKKIGKGAIEGGGNQKILKSLIDSHMNK